jgi:prepilin-type N-terminal cleavage/methylation domain-containing protein
MNFSKQISKGFTIIELVVVVAIIGVLATLTFIAYSKIQSKSFDSGISVDLVKMSTAQLKYVSNHGTYGKPYYSADGADEELDFTPSNGNIVDVVVNSTDYCIRVYNSKGTKNSIYNSTYKETSPGVCTVLEPSNSAISDYSGPKIWNGRSFSGGYTICSLSSESLVYCSGKGNFGQRGDGLNYDNNTWSAFNMSGLLSGKKIKQVISSEGNTCVLANDGNAYCTGINQFGQLGRGDVNDSNVPVLVSNTGVLLNKTIKTISNSHWAFCALASDDQVYCWGGNWAGQLGNNSNNQSSLPTAVNTSGVLSGKKIKLLGSGGSYANHHFCAIANDNKLYCWGANSVGQLGNNSTSDSNTPVAVYDQGLLRNKSITNVRMGSSHTCALTSGGVLYCWGWNDYGQLGDGTNNNSSVPIAVNINNISGNKLIRDFVLGYGYTCLLTGDNKIYCTGQNNWNEFGNGNQTNSNTLTATDMNNFGNKTVSSLVGLADSMCAITNDGSLYCWGRNDMGQLADGTYIQKSTPTLSFNVP